MLANLITLYGIVTGNFLNYPANFLLGYFQPSVE